MKTLLSIVLFLFIFQLQNIACGNNDSNFDFGDLKIRCACDDEEYSTASKLKLEEKWYEKIGLPPPPSCSPEEAIQKNKPQTY